MNVKGADEKKGEEPNKLVAVVVAVAAPSRATTERQQEKEVFRQTWLVVS